MTLTKTLSSIGSLLALLPGLAKAQTNLSFDFSADSVANYRQSPNSVAFEGGTFGIHIRDGVLIYQTGCIAPFYFAPSIPCPIGASGFITAGDFDGDGIEDVGDYLSVLNITAASILLPFVPEQAKLVAAPPSLLPRPLAGFTNDSRSVFYNIQTPLIRQYSITQYDFERQYSAAERARYDGEAVPGTYQYVFPSLRGSGSLQPLAITLFPALDGFRKINNQKTGFQFTGLTFDDGFAVLNPNAINTITWAGNDPSLIIPSLDRAFFSIKPLENPNDPLSDPVQYDEDAAGVPNPTLPIYPNFLGPQVSRVVLPSALDTSYTIPPQFLLPGQTGVIDLEFVLRRPNNSVTTDNSTVRFRLPVRVTNPFLVPPPPNVASAVFNDKNGDFDNDGVSNFDEWVFGSDRTSASSTPASPSMSFAGGSTAPKNSSPFVSFDETADAGAWEFKVSKLRNPVPKLVYEIQRSTDMVNWTTVKAGDPDWILTDDDIKSEIKITSRKPEVNGGGFFRAKVTEK